MGKIASLQALAAAVEGLSGGHCETDVAIEIMLPYGNCSLSKYPSSVPGKVVTYYGEGRTGTAHARELTSSLDTLSRLIRHELAGWAWHAGNSGEDDRPSACLTEPDGECRDFTGSAATPELALCAATLRAIAGRRVTP